MRNNIIKITITAGITMLTFSNVQAEWFVGSDTAQQEVLPYPSSLSDSDFSLNDILSYKESRNATSNNVSLFGGYRTTQNFSMQLEYQDDLSFGIDDMFAGSSLWFPEVGSQNFESNGLFLSGISSYPINDNGFLYMKGGLFNWEVDPNYNQTNAKYLGQTRGTDIFYGLGANYDLNARFGVSAEWERYQMEESDIDYLSTKLKFKF
ncbi:MAG: outer membrane beta-barrel protein [Gammaproteobacteria bacterium]|nr:MAG: outer membrane beta-barrel protein [Gammaproteobacteria bacterium]